MYNLLGSCIPIFIIAHLIKVDSAPRCNLKSIFQTPKRNYDRFEILERSNFDADPESTPINHVSDCPRSFANAQVLLRFGDDATPYRKPSAPSCGCGGNCQCRNSAIPYPVFYPVPLLVPNCLFFNAMNAMKNLITDNNNNNKNIKASNIIGDSCENLNDEEEATTIINNHPEILESVEIPEPTIASLTNQIEEKTEDNRIETTTIEDVDNTGSDENQNQSDLALNATTISTDNTTKPELEVENDKPNIKQLLDDSLVPVVYCNCNDEKPKLLVTYPIVNKNPETIEVSKTAPSSTITPKQLLELLVPRVVDELMARKAALQQQPKYQYGGYKMAESRGAGYYSNPTKTVLYRQPTVVEIVKTKNPNNLGVANSNFNHAQYCRCPYCAKYDREYNE